jgi:hypothetical protein
MEPPVQDRAPEADRAATRARDGAPTGAPAHGAQARRADARKNQGAGAFGEIDRRYAIRSARCCVFASPA